VPRPRALCEWVRTPFRGFNRILGLIDARVIRASSLSQMNAALAELTATVERQQARMAQLEAEREAGLGAADFPPLLGEVRLARVQLGEVSVQLQRKLLEGQEYMLDLLREEFERLIAPGVVKLHIVTEHRVAVDSSDHKFPRGTKNDNTRHPRFVRKCAQLFRRQIFHLDLGCAGGGLVWDFLLAGHHSYGVEGSDYSLVNQRALWRVLPDNLFTADVTKSFYFVDAAGNRRRFDVITAWELLEHVSEAGLPGLFTNLHETLADDGVFVASVATFTDRDPATGAVWHVTVQPRQWWKKQFENAGFKLVEGLFELGDYARGSGNPHADDWDAATQPQMGFHITARRQ